MKRPEIQVQLIHIDGPMKGEIQEFSGPVISLGRHPDCDVVFPPEMKVISRHHAEIKREGNRFKLVDHSTNGTYVNGKQVQEVFLKDGDVLIIGTGGPKVSFLSTMITATGEQGMGTGRDRENPVPETPFTPPISGQQPAPVPAAAVKEFPVGAASRHVLAPEEKPRQPASRAEEQSGVAKPLVIQYGTTLKTFKSLPVTIGRGTDCDFFLEHPDVLEHHARIFFDQGQYRIQDLTGRNLVTVNLQPVSNEAPLPADARLSLSPHGPHFQFLGDGRLAEVTDPEPKKSPDAARPGTKRPSPPHPATGGGRRKIVWGGIITILCLAASAALLVFIGQNGGKTAANPVMQRFHSVVEYFRQLISR